MGLAPYGTPRYVTRIYEDLIDVKPDGTFRLNLDYFDFPAGLRMINQRFCKLFGGPAREPESEITQKEMDIAASIQVVTEEIVLKLARTIAGELGQSRLCLAGGVALNCVANGRLLREGPFEDIWIQPASGDAGGALGAALATHYEYLGNHRALSEQDPMRGAYLGPSFSNDAIATALDDLKAVYTKHDDDTLLPLVAKEISEGQVIGWFSDAMEFGPRALGARSILADPRSPHMQTTLNLKVKQRESFRPFAPAVLKERAADWFELESESPYMMLVATVANHQRTTTPADKAAFGIEQLKQTRSTIPCRYPCRLFGQGANRRRRYQPTISSITNRVRGHHRLPGTHQHVIQCSGRADCLSPGGRVSLLYEYRDRSAGHWQLPTEERGPTINQRTSSPVRARLGAIDEHTYPTCRNAERNPFFWIDLFIAGCVDLCWPHALAF